ncbi:MAG: MerR family transcriptional regulator [Oscillospiraceae bacterium]|nr:MerR family transcriptional regulator [Oscillospiraceae bacterium]
MNELISIQSLASELGVSTRTLRHYEDVGLLTSVRPADKQQRYYTDDAIARIQQIRILRKMEIPIKDIISIYQNEETTNIIAVFTQKITSIDENIATLTELRAIVEDFRQELLARGITSASDLPALIDIAAEHKPVVVHDSNHMERLETVSEKRKRELIIRYVDMRPMRVLSSYLKGTNRTKACSEDEFIAEYTKLTGSDYRAYHGEIFEGASSHREGHVLTRKIPRDCVNDSPYEDYMLDGLFIAETTINGLEDVGEVWDAMKEWLSECDYLEIDDISAGGQRDSVYGCAAITDEIHQLLGDVADVYKWDLLIPVRRKQHD